MLRSLSVHSRDEWSCRTLLYCFFLFFCFGFVGCSCTFFLVIIFHLCAIKVRQINYCREQHKQMNEISTHADTHARSWCLKKWVSHLWCDVRQVSKEDEKKIVVKFKFIVDDFFLLFWLTQCREYLRTPRDDTRSDEFDNGFRSCNMISFHFIFNTKIMQVTCHSKHITITHLRVSGWSGLLWFGYLIESNQKLIAYIDQNNATMRTTIKCTIIIIIFMYWFIYNGWLALKYAEIC